MTTDHDTDNTDITGRDSYIMAEALYLATKWIDAQPKEYRSLSNQEDMRAILDARWPSFKEIFAQTARPAVVLKFPRLVSDSDDGPPEGTA